MQTKTIERVEISRLIKDPNNARKHDKKNLEAIKGSLAKFGQQKPIVVNMNDIVVAGNGTLEAANQLGWNHIDVVRTDLEGFNAAAYAIADNRTAELAAWDDGVLGSQLLSLHTDGFDLASIGFDTGDWDEPKQETEGLTDPDEVPEVDGNTYGVKTGDIWQLGKHRMMCGDSTKAEDVERLMDGKKADAVVSDPPYGMNLDTDYSKLPDSNRMGQAKKYKPIAGDQKEFNPTHILDKFSYCNEILLFGADYYAKYLPLGSWYVWDKRVTENFDLMIGSAFELIWSNSKHKREIARINNTLFSGESDAKNKVHPSQKPIKLIEWLFDRVRGYFIADLYLGSGTTLIACEKTGRICYGMEIDPHYCSVIIKRWEDFTGNKAVKI